LVVGLVASALAAVTWIVNGYPGLFTTIALLVAAIALVAVIRDESDFFDGYSPILWLSSFGLLVLTGVPAIASASRRVRS